MCLYIYHRCSMYGIFTYIYHQNGPNVGKYSIHGASGYLKKSKYKYTCIISTLSRVFDKYHVAKRCCGVKTKNHTHVGSVQNPRSFVLTWFIEVPMYTNIPLHYSTLHYITLHYITSHYITLHAYIHTYIHTYITFITLHYITLH